MRFIRIMVCLVLAAGTACGASVHFIQNAVNDADGTSLSAVATNAWLETGNAYPTVTSPAVYGGYRFTHWSSDRAPSETYRDPWGRAQNPVSFVLLEDTTLTAHYLPASQDSDGDGVPDWYEIEYYGSLTNGAAYDGDGDSIPLLDEYTGCTHPLYGNISQQGGVFWADSGLVTCNLAGYPRYILRSEPAGAVDQTAIVAPGTVISTPSLAGNASFGYWSLDGVRQADAWGVAYPQITFTVQTTDRECVAYLFTGDSDGDGIPDGYEQYYFGTLANNGASDADGDELTLAQEYSGGTSPLYANSSQPGGVFWADSGFVTCNLAGFATYVLRSEPAGAVDESGSVPSGTVITTPSLAGNASFGYWTLDGVRQADAWGVAYPQVTFTVQTTNRECVAYLFTGDSDGDGIPDAYEQYYFGTLANNGASDGDGDGLTLAQEYSGGTSPLYADSSQPDGVFWQDSGLVTVNLQSFDRTEYILVEGVPTRFFTRWPTNVTDARLGPSTAPAMGDWNGDGLPDLFVGGSNGVLRVFENAGSPMVPNLVERSTNFTALAGLWAGLTNLAPALGDWTGDGKADLAVGGDAGRVVLIASTGNFQSPQQPAITSVLVLASSSAIPALADVNGDHYADLFVLLDDGTVNLHINTRDALLPFTTNAVQTNVLGTTVPSATGIAALDDNGDGIMDLLISDNTGHIWEFGGGTGGTYALISKVFGGTYDGFAPRLTITAGDFSGDGAADLIGGSADGGLVYLKNPAEHLLISPPTATLPTGHQTTFTNLTAAGNVTWTLLRNPSGGSVNSSNGVYTAGATPGMDFVQAAATNGLTGRAYVNVISTNDIASFGKAVIVAGGRDLNDPVWLATDYIANRAYSVLCYKGYARENIQYLSFNPGRDIDGDGLTNDIAGFSSSVNVSSTFTHWVGNANRLFVYLVDHGSASPDGAYFRLNTGENLTSAQLNAWLTAIQNQSGTEVVVVLDFCYAGRFLQDLAYAGPARRVVIAATSPTELTYFLSGGMVSFSDLFLSGLLEGLDLQQAFLLARSGMQGYQSPTLDDTGDGVYQANVDGAIAAQIQVGATHLAGKDVPIIGEVAPSQTLSAGITATLWADRIQSVYPIQGIYCTILPPSFSANTNVGVPVTGVSEVELILDASGRYQTSFDGFTEAGVYRVNYYARDIWGSVSPPQPGLVIQAGFDERMILVAGGTTNDPQWSALANLAATAYRTALARRIGKTGIRYLSAAPSQDADGDGTNDVAGSASLAALAQAITNWAAGANKLTVYLLGSSTTANGLCRLNATESVSATQLGGWLDSFQVTNRSVTVVMDFDGSGSYIPSLAAPGGRERIVIASTKAGTTSVRAAGGLVSFSQFFLNGIFDGQSLGAAFNAARDAIRNASGWVRQTPQLDDNGNGIADQKNLDGLVAAQRYLGAAFVTGDDSPFIGEVVPVQNVVSGSPVLLWAQDILDRAGISNVWCVITPPDYGGQGDLPQTNLTWNAGTSRYEVVCTNFTMPGTYVCTFYARNNVGLLSSPKQSEVTVTDAFEADDAAACATIFPVGDAEEHSLHSVLDEDWVKFYAPTGLVFNIEATQLGTNSDLVLNLYYEQWDGTLTWVDRADGYGTGAGETESLVVDLKNAQSGLLPGVYYVRVSSADTNLFGPGSEYELRIYEPTGTGGGVITITFGGGSGVLAYLQVHITPQLAGAGWRLQGQTAYHTNPDDTETVSQGGSPVIEFRPVSGWDGPPRRTVQVTLGDTTVIPASYTRSAQLVVGPAGDLSFSGFVGGPFSPTMITCLLTNSGEGALRWAAIGTSNWLTLSATNGLLAGGAQTNITMRINTNANTLVGGSYTSAIGFMNQSNGLGNTTRRVILSVVPPSAILGVSPLTGLSSSGYVGGPFSPTGITYTLTNGGGSNLVWSASKTASWLTLASSNGVLAGGASTNVVVTINTQANSLAASNYTDTVSFSNTSTGLGNTDRPVNLAVLVHPPVLLANPQVLTNGRLAMTLHGVTNRIYSILGTTNLRQPLINWTEVLRLTNTGGQTPFTNPPSSASPQFYRAKEL